MGRFLRLDSIRNFSTVLVLDDVNRVVAGAGHEHPAVGRDDHVVGAQVDVDVAHTAVVFGVDDADVAAAPIADVEVHLVGAHDASVRELADGDGRLRGGSILG